MRDATFVGPEAAGFFGQTGYTDLRQEHAWLRAKGALFERILAHVERRLAPARPDRWFVDVGCSYGHLGKLFEGKGWRVAGVDVAPNILEHHRLHGTFPVYPSLDTPEIPDGEVSALAIIDMLELVEDPAGLLSIACRKLRRGGLAFLRLRNVNCHLRLAARMRPLIGPYWLGRIEGGFKFYFTPRGFACAARRAGFSEVKLIYRFPGYRYSGKMQAVHFAAQKVAQFTGGLVNLETAFFVECRKG